MVEAASTKAVMREAFYAQAVGDAMGYQFEFYEATPPEFRNYRRDQQQKLNLTDDTQMAMFGQEGINWAPGHTVAGIVKSVERAYVRWYNTQSYNPIIPDDSGLASLPAMNVTRAPGGRCLSSLRRIQRGLRPEPNRGRGCGSVMRLLPFAGLFLVEEGFTYDEVQSIAEGSGRITHNDFRSVRAVKEYMEVAWSLMAGNKREGLGYSAKKISDLGGGWIADECVPMAAWAVQVADTFDDLLDITICHAGDSDSVAAVACGLWALAGETGYHKYLHRLVEKPIIDILFD